MQCQCYAKDQAKGYLADGCGQFNVFEVVNDNNAYKNLDVFSTNMIGYGGYVGEGPCGPQCNAATLGQEVDLIAKSTNTEATAGATSTPTKGPGAAFRRPKRVIATSSSCSTSRRAPCSSRSFIRSAPPRR